MKERIFLLEADFLKAIAHPTRIQILEQLRNGEKCVCEFIEELDIEQSNISQHLSVLRKQGIVTYRKDGLKAMYQVNYQEIYTILDKVKDILLSQVETTVSLLKNRDRGGE